MGVARACSVNGILQVAERVADGGVLAADGVAHHKQGDASGDIAQRSDPGGQAVGPTEKSPPRTYQEVRWRDMDAIKVLIEEAVQLLLIEWREVDLVLAARLVERYQFGLVAKQPLQLHAWVMVQAAWAPQETLHLWQGVQRSPWTRDDLGTHPWLASCVADARCEWICLVFPPDRRR